MSIFFLFDQTNCSRIVIIFVCELQCGINERPVILYEFLAAKRLCIKKSFYLFHQKRKMGIEFILPFGVISVLAVFLCHPVYEGVTATIPDR
ncbi:MAG: hypothetical protein BWX92_01002 [Deltaproteobacteria bacterium ADurb.Bin135]|nr:MAG: hypothetical protein BWX92_01002 [Deltaproteobacteria bacterium ADurb.Bin135]